jgi:hypothetical protein
MNFLSSVSITTIVLNFILHSTILLSIGFMVASLLQRRVAALQSAVLRTTLCFTLLAPAISTAPIQLPTRIGRTHFAL